MNNTPTKNAVNDNADMKANRYAKAAAGRATLAKYVAHLNAGGTIVVSTCTKATKFDRRHVAMLKVGASGSLYMQRGKSWDCIDYATVKGYR